MKIIWCMFLEMWSMTDIFFSHFVPKIMIICCTVTEIWGIKDVIAVFCPFTSLTTQKIKILEKLKKIPGDIIILHKCTKNHDHMLYCSWDTACGGCNYFSLWAIFCPFTLRTAQKIKILQKWHKCTKNHDHMLYCSWDMTSDGDI